MTDIWQLILNQCSISSQLIILTTNRLLADKLHILTLDVTYNIDDTVLMQHKFRKLNCLRASGNAAIKNISFLSELIELEIVGPICEIDQSSINGLNLYKLNAACNPNISNVNFMSNLIELDASVDCGIDQKGISGLNLYKLDVSYNEKIFDVNDHSNLLELNAGGLECGVGQMGLHRLNLFKLDVFYNPKINYVARMTLLYELDAGYCKIDQKGIEGLNLMKLGADHNFAITSFSGFRPNSKIENTTVKQIFTMKKNMGS